MTPPATEPPPPHDAPNDPGLSKVVVRNIRSLVEMRYREDRRRGFSDRVAEQIARFTGSMTFVYVHLSILLAWLAINAGWLPLLPRWDPPPFVMLAMIGSVEAIFLSTFILITQNRQQRIAERRAEMDLQISLLIEHELTRAIRLLDSVAVKLQVERPPEEELDELKRDVNPSKVAKVVEDSQADFE